MDTDTRPIAEMLENCGSRYPYLEKVWVGQTGASKPFLKRHGVEYDIQSGTRNTVDHSLHEHWERVHQMSKTQE
jgi:hypothetical protein